MVSHASRNLLPSLFTPRIFTGMRVNTRELRLRLSVSAEDIVWLSCINPAGESTESKLRFPLAATLPDSYNALSCRALGAFFATHSPYGCGQNAFSGAMNGLSRLHREPSPRESQRTEGFSPHSERQHEERA